MPIRKKKTLTVPEIPEGETDETCLEHTKTMKKEMAKTSNRDFTQIRELMDLTYPFRRKDIVTEPVSVPSLLKLYPALQLPSEVS